MAKVNLPAIQVPKQLRTDAEVGKFFDAVTFNIFQLYTRTGGGADLFEELQKQIDENKQAIIVNAANILANSIAISKNIIDIAANTAAIIANALAIAVNAQDILALQQTFSWKLIPADEEITIATDQQMIVADGITIDGSLIMNGDLSLI